MNFRLHEMRWPEVKKMMAKPNIVVLPIGSVEQHGKHLPLNVDSAIGTYIAEHAAEQAMKKGKIHVLVAPTIHYSDTSYHKMFPGTVGVKVQTLINMVVDIVESFLQQGFSTILVLNSHLQNDCSVESAVRIVADRYPKAKLFAVGTVFLEGAGDFNLIRSGLKGLGHALETETAECMIIQPEHVHLERAEKGSRTLPLSDKYIGGTGEFKGRGVLYHTGATGNEKTGTFGDPTKASKELGENILNAQVNALAEMLVQMVRGTGQKSRQKKITGRY